MNVAQMIRYASSAICIFGIADQSSIATSLPANGNETANANRNIHFMNVTTEYLAIRGLNIPRYIEKLRMFRTIMKMPKGVLSATPPGVDDLLIIK